MLLSSILLMQEKDWEVGEEICYDSLNKKC